MSMVAAIDRLIQGRMDKDPVATPPPPPPARSSPRRLYQDDMLGKTLNDRQALDAKASAAATTPCKKIPLSCSFKEERFFDAPESPFEGSETSSVCDYSAFENLENNTELEETTADSGDSKDEAMELERHRNAEETLEIVLQKLAAGGLAVPPTLLERGGREIRDGVEGLDIAGQLHVKMMVEAAVARGAARAEFEEQLQAEIDSKNSEIEVKRRELTRLRDKVRYNELIHREISQRNQEAIEMARSKRRARQKQVRWALTSASVFVAGGIAAALVYKYTNLHDLEAWKSSRAESSSTGSK